LTNKTSNPVGNQKPYYRQQIAGQVRSAFRLDEKREKQIEKVKTSAEASQVLLDWEHVQFVVVAMEPGCVWCPVSVNET